MEFLGGHQETIAKAAGVKGEHKARLNVSNDLSPP